MTINPNGKDYSYTITPNPQTTGSSSNPVVDTTIDQNVTANIAGLTVNNAILNVTDAAFAPGHSFISLTPLLAYANCNEESGYSLKSTSVLNTLRLQHMPQSTKHQ